MNLGLMDQLDAAARDALGRVRAYAREKPDWSASQPGRVTAEIARRWGSVDPWTHCGHVDSPRPCGAQAHRPGHVMCPPCATAAALATIGTPEDYVCDGCGGTSRMLTAGSIVVGPAIVSYGLCRSCVAREKGTRA